MCFEVDHLQVQGPWSVAADEVEKRWPERQGRMEWKSGVRIGLELQYGGGIETSNLGGLVHGEEKHTL